MIQHLRSVPLSSAISNLAVSPDGSLIALATREAVDLVSAENGRTVVHIPTAIASTGLSISSDNKLLAVASGEPTVVVYHCDGGKVALKLSRDTVVDFLRKQKQPQVAFIPKSQTLVTCGQGSDVTLWNCKSGKWEHLIRIPHKNGFVVISPDGQHLAILSEPTPKEYLRQVTMYRVHHGLQSLWNKGHQSDRGVNSGAFSPLGTRLATCILGENEVRVWDVKTGKSLASLPQDKTAPWCGVAFCGDERHLLKLTSRSIALYRIDTAKLISKTERKKSTEFLGFGTSGDGKMLVTFGASKAIDIWRIHRGTVKP